jgi:hypothetical protein
VPVGAVGSGAVPVVGFGVSMFEMPVGDGEAAAGAGLAAVPEPLPEGLFLSWLQPIIAAHSTTTHRENFFIVR